MRQSALFMCLLVLLVGLLALDAVFGLGMVSPESRGVPNPIVCKLFRCPK